MKMGLLGIVVAIVIVVIIGWAVATNKPVEEAAPLTSPDPDQELTDTTSGGNGGQFIQLAPTDVPDAVTPEATETDDEVVANETTPAATGKTVQVTVDETGFTPGVVTIAVGDTVTFTNDGQGKHWPASDVHPTHEILPAFDSNRGLETGEAYSHTFTEAGTWKCHDHLVPRNTCTVVVE